jgi:peptidoglycan/LPS O-acetylase OafA/YrhL
MMLSRVPSWVLLAAGLTGVGLTAAYGSIDVHESLSWWWQLAWLLGVVLMVLALSTYVERRGWSVEALLRKRRERR